MLRYGLRSIVGHRRGHIGTAVIIAAGIALLSGCASVLATGLSESTPLPDRALLVQFPLIIGGWALAVVLYAVVSTTGVSVDGRADELASLQTLGATRRQVARLIAGETVVVGSAALVPGVLAGTLAGRVLLGQLSAIGRISPETTFAPDVLQMICAAVLVVATSGLAAFIRVSRPGAGPSTSARKVRWSAAAVCIVAGLGSSSAVFAFDADGIHTTAAAGPGCVLLAIGLSMLAPESLSLVRVVSGRSVVGFGGLAGYLAAITARVAPQRVLPVVTFATLFIGVTAGTLSMQGIENSSGADTGAQGQLMASINYSVVGAIAAFMAIALVNNLIGSIRRRKPEFDSMTSIGGTATQVVRTLTVETASGLTAAAVVGLSGAAIAIAPFAYVKTGSVWHAISPTVFLVTVLGTVVFTLGVVQVIARRLLGTDRSAIPSP